MNLPTYGRYAQDNLTTFLDDLNSYFSIKGIAEDARKITILCTQLRHAAKIYVETEFIRIDLPATFDGWVVHLNAQFVT